MCLQNLKPIFSASLVFLCGAALADATQPSAAMSLEDLMQVEVTSVSKKPQRLANVAASIFVITAEDIRLSGANSIPEALRLAPGVDATRVAGNRWAVSMRGFADRVANKLQVLVDGRSVFDPEFSGVLWEQVLIPLDDIERIEVIRGPGAGIWGSNAVNGVISIITRSAAATQGSQASVGAGKIEGGYAKVRWGGHDAERDIYYRVYGSAQDASAPQAPYAAAQDDWSNAALGFRMDGYAAGGARWDVSGDIAQGTGDSRTMRLGPLHVVPGTFPGTVPGSVSGDFKNLSLRARSEHKMDNGSNVEVQAALSHLDYQLFGSGDKRTTFDLGMQHRLAIGKQHDVIWGVDYRFSQDTMQVNDFLSMKEPELSAHYVGVFGQDEITLADTLRMTLGLRLDRSPFTGWESSPSARLAWNLEPTQTLWASVSRAVRAPSRGEVGLGMNSFSPPQLTPFGRLPTLTHLYTDNGFKSEILLGYELGLRSQWAPSLSSDLTLFSHKYTDLRGPGTPVVSYAYLPNYLDLTVPVINPANLTLNGLELSADWRAAQNWRFQAAYTYNDVANLDAAQATLAALFLPKDIVSLRASWTPASNVNLDVWWRHVGARESATPAQARNAYTSIDVRLGWRPNKTMEFSLVGQNLSNGECAALDGATLAYELMGSVAACMPRMYGVQARFDF